MKPSGMIMMFGLFTLWGCSRKETLYSGNFDGRDYSFYHHTANRVFNKAYYQSFRLEGVRSTVQISDQTTSKGYPYSFDIYSEVPHGIIDSTTYQYQHVYDGRSTAYSVLYIDPAQFQPAEFGQLLSFFQSAWPAIQSKVPLFQGYRTLHPVALVYGTDQQFEKTYRYGDETITIWTDGTIAYSPSKGALESSNLSNKVQMPGKMIYVEKGGPFTIDGLEAFKDGKGRSIGDDFRIENL